MKYLLLSIAVLASISTHAQELPKLQSQFPLKWKAKIGGTSFKTNFLVHDGLLIVGSNGNHFRDWNLDKDNGIYILHPKSGKILQHFADEGLGDMDVNGVIAFGNHIYFGNDNDEFLCYDTCGKQIWRVPVSGDVESPPVLLDIDCNGTKEIIFGTEAGEVAALDPRNGKTVWSFKIKDFSGWSKTDNRFLFKVGAYFSNGGGFVAKPAVSDLNRDGVPDLIYNCRDNYTYAINGENGKMLWKFNHGEIWYCANAPLVVEGRKGKEIYLLSERKKENARYGSELVMVKLNEKGIQQKTFPDTYHYSINYTPVAHSGNLITVDRDSLAILNIKTGELKLQSLAYDDYNKTGDYYYYNYYRTVTAQPVLFDILAKGSDQLIITDEYGTVQILDGGNFKTLKRYMLPAGTETSSLIADIDDDGKMEMLIGCRDGYLYCYDLKRSANGSIASLK